MSFLGKSTPRCPQHPGIFAFREIPCVSSSGTRFQAYYLSLTCHNAALLNVKLGRWMDAQELVDEGIEFTKDTSGNCRGWREGVANVKLDPGRKTHHFFAGEWLGGTQGSGKSLRKRPTSNGERHGAMRLRKEVRKRL